ncbi:hypothetical protein CL635_02610 [bacterium]|nr:hypothetical protein [bacterium]|tara:strand:+ start:14998 stop:17526 length:2529 start_codon:yes stop_codon:yes gene_type:complete
MAELPSQLQGAVEKINSQIPIAEDRGNEQCTSHDQDTNPEENRDIGETQLSGFFGSREAVLIRMQSVGLLKQPQFLAAVEKIKETGNGSITTPHDFAHAVFLEVTGSKAITQHLVKRLLNHLSEGEEEFARGTDGIIIEPCVGAGGMGNVSYVHLYGEDGRHKGPVAIKDANAFRPDSKDRLRFKTEIAIMSQHSNGKAEDGTGYRTVLPQYYECYGEASYAMEFLKGKTLGEFMKEVHKTGESMDPQIAMDLFVAILIKLKNFRGDIHRDIKPDNIMVLDDGTIRLLDCGLSREENPDVRVTETRDHAMGTVTHMAPEQLDKGGKGGRDKTSDLYALAATIYEMLTGHLPYEGDEVMDFVSAHKEGKPPTFSVVSQSSVKAHKRSVSVSGSIDSEEVFRTDTRLRQALKKALEQMLSIEPHNRLLTNMEDRLIPDPAYTTKEVMMLDIDQDEVGEEIDKWIEKLLPHSSFNKADIKDGDPSIFASALVPEEGELDPELAVGSLRTRGEVHRILSTSIEEETVEPTKPAIIKRSNTTRWAVAATVGVAVTIAGVAYSLSGKKKDEQVKVPVHKSPIAKVDPKKPIVGKLDPPPKTPEVLVNTPAKFRPYPGSEKTELIHNEYGVSFLNVGDDVVVLVHDEKNIASRNGDRGRLLGTVFNQFNKNERWENGYNISGSVTFSGDGVSAARVPMEDIDKYRKEIGSAETQENASTICNKYQVGNYVLIIVDGESESVLHYIGDDAGKPGAPSSVVFPNPLEAAKHLRSISSDSDRTIFDDLMAMQFTDARQGKNNLSLKNKDGYDRSGRRILSESDFQEVQKKLMQSKNTYFGVRGSEGAIAENR